MATVHIHAIYTRPDKAVDYGVKDKVGELRDGITNGIEYAINDKTGEAVYKTLSSYMNCKVDNAIDDFHYYANMGRGNKETKLKTKNGLEVVAWHLWQSFKGHECTPETANEIGMKLAREMFPRFPCVVSTHTNTDNIHNHIMVCAWNMDGGKWNNDNSHYRALRKTSDRLCDEYGLSVLEETRNVNLLSFVDKDGVKRYYEPTSRKNDLIKEREQGRVTGSIDDYRNTPTYETVTYKRQTNVASIQSDIDSLLPSIRSYDELLDRLRELGYIVNAKKKNGEWLRHVSFVAPMSQRATRDSAIGDGIFYTRENLTRHIENKENEKSREHGGDKITHGEGIVVDGVKYIPTYEYGRFNVSDLHEDYRVAADSGGGLVTVSRNELEKANVRSIFEREKELTTSIYDTSVLERILAEEEAAKRRKTKYVPDTQEAVLLNRLQDELRCLSFIERYKVYSLEQVNDLYKAVYDNYNRSVEELDRLDGLIEHFNEVLTLPGKAKEIERRISENADNVEYMLEDYFTDTIALRDITDTMEKYGIDTDEGIDQLNAKISDGMTSEADYRSRLLELRDRLDDYSNCMAVFSRIEHYEQEDKAKAVERFNTIRDEGASKQRNRKDKGER